jgi:hypothetical protein
MESAGPEDVQGMARDVPWRIPDRTTRLAFCRNLFGLRDAPQSETVAALERSVGIAGESEGVTLL